MTANPEYVNILRKQHGDCSICCEPCTDLGQGVNSALLDVGTLSACLASHHSGANAALAEFEQIRLPENRALVRLTKVRGLSWRCTEQLCQLPSAKARQHCLMPDRSQVLHNFDCLCTHPAGSCTH